MQATSRITNLLSQEQLAALGEIAANSAELEWMVGFTVMWLLKINGKQANALIGGVMLSGRISILEQVGGECLRRPKDKKQLKDLTSKLMHLAIARNTVIHGTWVAKGKHLSMEESLDMEFGYKAPGNVIARNPKNTQRFSAKDLKGLATDLHSIRVELWDFAKKHWWRGWTNAVFRKQGFEGLKGLVKESPLD